MLGFGLCRTAYLLSFVYLGSSACILDNALLVFWTGALASGAVTAVLA